MREHMFRILCMPSAAQGYANPLPATNPFPGNQPQQGGPYFNAGAPTAGVSCVQTLTIGGTPTSGNFTLTFGGQTTGAIAWTATDATLETNISTALNALTNIGPSGTTVAAGSGSSGIGTYTITFQNQNGELTVPALSIGANNLLGTSPTVSVAVTTTGVSPTLRGGYTGTTVVDYVTNREYINAGTPSAPSYVRSAYNMAVVPLTATSLTTGGAIGSWTPPEGGPVFVTRCMVYVSTGSTGAANLTAGVATNSTTSATNLIAATSVHTAGTLIDSFTTQIVAATAAESGITALAQYMTASQSVTFTGSATTAGMVATAYIEYFKP